MNERSSDAPPERDWKSEVCEIASALGIEYVPDQGATWPGEIDALLHEVRRLRSADERRFDAPPGIYRDGTVSPNGLPQEVVDIVDERRARRAEASDTALLDGEMPIFRFLQARLSRYDAQPEKLQEVAHGLAKLIGAEGERRSNAIEPCDVDIVWSGMCAHGTKGCREEHRDVLRRPDPSADETEITRRLVVTDLCDFLAFEKRPHNRERLKRAIEFVEGCPVPWDGDRLRRSDASADAAAFELGFRAGWTAAFAAFTGDGPGNVEAALADRERASR